MLSLIRRPTGPVGHRRGVTLVEMLVVVALVVLMMVILVQIFQAATGAITTSRTIQELDVNLRQVDSIIRSDLAGVTAKMTPPNDPANKSGYFEYGENAFADAQGEDTDDYMAFTTKAPEGQVFSGRQWLGGRGGTINQNVQPTTINSQVAEIIYFLRNGNLYRRVFLVVPERASSITRGTQNGGQYVTPIFGPNSGLYYYSTSLLGGSTIVSWLGMNDISCRPAPNNSTNITNTVPPVPNDLGTLTNRENRAFRPRFVNDFTGPAGNGGDGIPDDNNGDGIHDYYPTLYYDGSQSGAYNYHAPDSLMHEVVSYTAGLRQTPSYNVYAFPFIYPGMYSVFDQTRSNIAGNLGWVHGLSGNQNPVPNHGPLDVGDNLLTPVQGQGQTWWGFPTWRETMTGFKTGNPGNNGGWTDPINFITLFGSSNNYTQPFGLQPYAPGNLPTTNTANLLPPLNLMNNPPPPAFTDNAGSTTSFVTNPGAPAGTPNPVWEDDLLLTGVRSFDIKAYDLNAPLYNVVNNNPNNSTYISAGYQDLGYGASNYLAGPSGLNATSQTTVPWQSVGGEPQGFGHEGRIPPLYSDFRPHPRTGANIGDSSAGVMRLARVWDSWSTDYVNAPDSDIFLHGYSALSPNGSPIYPSFNAPYPSPLRGIQIQIRLTDPRNQRAKSITIRHDFTDKL